MMDPRFSYLIDSDNIQANFSSNTFTLVSLPQARLKLDAVKIDARRDLESSGEILQCGQSFTRTDIFVGGSGLSGQEEEFAFSEAGDLVIDGEVDFEFVPVPAPQTWEFAEAGDLVIDGELSVGTETAHDEAGDIVIDGEVVLDAIIAVDLRVTQALGEALAAAHEGLAVTQAWLEAAATAAASMAVTQAGLEASARFNAELQVDQAVGEAIRRENAEILVDQVLCEVIISNWRRVDFMPTLARFM